MGATHLRAWRAAGVEPLGVTARTEASALAFAERHGIRAFSSFEALLEGCDVLDLCVPTDLHAPLAIRAAEAGRHVVCEKPIALTVEDARAMIDACEGHGVRLYVAQVLRFFPAYREARELILEGAVGEVRRVHLSRASEVPDGSWFRDPGRSGGLALDLAIHDVDWALWTLGRPDQVRREPYPAALPESAERVDLRLVWSSGATAVVEGSWNLPEARTRFVVEGTEGRLDGEGGRLVLTRTTNGPGVPETVGLPEGDPYTEQARHVAHALGSDAPFEVDATEALTALELLSS